MTATLRRSSQIRYPGQELRLLLDGYLPFMDSSEFPHDPCCTNVLCPEPVATACGFVDLLPTGPMWDVQKELVREAIISWGAIPDGSLDIFRCPSMVTYSVYISQTLQCAVEDIIKPYVRNSYPDTAQAENLPDWLDKYGWIDCYRNNCTRSYLSRFSPYYQFTDPQCPERQYCPAIFSEDFNNALNYALVQSLHRSSLGFIKNLAGINWVIEPLGARLQPQQPYATIVQEYLNGLCEEEEAPCWCEEVQLELVPITDELPLPIDRICLGEFFSGDNRIFVDAEQTYICENLPPMQIYPAIIAAECLVRSFLPRTCPNIIVPPVMPDPP